MDKKYQSILTEYADIQTKLASTTDPQQLKDLGKRQAELALVVKKIERLKKLEKDLQGNEKLLQEKDEELKKAAAEEHEILKSEISNLKSAIEQSLLPRDPLDEKNIIM